MADGKLIQGTPSLVTPEMLTANAIANMVTPPAANDFFSTVKDAQMARGSYQPIGGITGATPAPFSSVLQKQLMQPTNETRYQLASRTGMQLPQLAGPPKKGIATASQKRAMPDVEYQVDGGVGAASQSGDTQYVDDKGWPVSLKQLLGSKYLSNEMIQKASIQNVRKFMNVTGGTEQERRELEYMMQRAMLEGFVRGVDITKDLKPGGIKMNLVNIPGKVCGRRYNTSVNGKTADGVDFDTAFWNRKDEAAQYTLFLHEVVGHALLNVDANHNNNTSSKFQQSERIMTPVYKDSVLANYNKMLNDLYSERSVPSKSKIGVKDYSSEKKNIGADWYPPLSGVDAGYNPGSSTPNSTPPKEGTDTYNNTSVSNNYTINPMEIGEMSLAPNTITSSGGGPRVMGPAATVTAPQGLGSDVATPTKTFAAGMADLSKRNSGADMAQAGMLLKSG